MSNTQQLTLTYQDTDYVYRRLLATLACLRRRDRIREIEIEASVRGLARTIADAIAPVVPGEDGRGKDDDADLPAGMDRRRNQNSLPLLPTCFHGRSCAGYI